MTVEDIFSGAESGLTMFFAYVNEVAGEIGMERAIALDTKVCQAMGAVQGKMMKEQVGIEEFDVQTASTCRPGGTHPPSGRHVLAGWRT
jgi:hypothetical protein